MSGSRSAFALGVAMLALAGPARAEAWQTYVNDRFGATVEYPGRFSVRDEPPTNGDGQRFHTADRSATLAVYGFLNVENETPQQVMEGRKLADTRYTFVVVRGGAFTLSGLRGERVVYLRCLRSREDRDIWVCADLDYPAAERTGWDPVVARIAKSLRAGKPW